jgi:hypothetical protein
VLAILLSEITWIPGLILFVIQAGFAGSTWTRDNLWIAGSLILSSLILIAILSVVAMALSAWVKWRIVAGALLVAIIPFGAGFAVATNSVLRIDGGHFFNLYYLLATVWTPLFNVEAEQAITATQAWIAILVYCSVCLLLLMRKVRAYEVVR